MLLDAVVDTLDALDPPAAEDALRVAAPGEPTESDELAAADAPVCTADEPFVDAALALLEPPVELWPEAEPEVC